MTTPALKVIKVEASEIELLVICERKRIYETASDGWMDIYTNYGIIRIRWKKGLRTDGRSGGWIVDFLIPNVGIKQKRRRGWFFHDCGFTFASWCYRNDRWPPLPFETMNDLYYQISVLPESKGGGGMSKTRMGIAHWGVNTSAGRKAYDSTDKSDRKNDGLVNITWNDK